MVAFAATCVRTGLPLQFNRGAGSLSIARHRRAAWGILRHGCYSLRHPARGNLRYPVAWLLFVARTRGIPRYGWFRTAFIPCDYLLGLSRRISPNDSTHLAPPNSLRHSAAWLPPRALGIYAPPMYPGHEWPGPRLVVVFCGMLARPLQPRFPVAHRGIPGLSLRRRTIPRHSCPHPYPGHEWPGYGCGAGGEVSPCPRTRVRAPHHLRVARHVTQCLCRQSGGPIIA